MSPLACNGSDDFTTANEASAPEGSAVPCSFGRSGSAMDYVRCHPEIMVQIYSFLDLPDRIVRLAMVDRAFARDTVRSGILCAHYGVNKLNVMGALNELERWVKCVEKKNSPAFNNGSTAISMPDSTRFHAWLQKIAQMKEIVVSREVKDNNCSQTSIGGCHPNIRSHWLVHLIADRTCALRNTWNGHVKQLSGFFDAVESAEEYSILMAIQDHELLQTTLPPRLYPGWTLHLPDADSMSLMAFNAESCVQCFRLATDCSPYMCHHGCSEFCCNRCRNSFEAKFAPDRISAPSDMSHSTTDGIISCRLCQRVAVPVVAPIRIRSIAVGQFPDPGDRRHVVATLIIHILLILPILIFWHMYGDIDGRGASIGGTILQNGTNELESAAEEQRQTSPLSWILTELTL